MNDPNLQKRERVRELRSMAGQARYQALRIAIVGAAPNMHAYAEELEDEAARLEDLLHAALPSVAKRKAGRGTKSQG